MYSVLRSSWCFTQSILRAFLSEMLTDTSLSPSYENFLLFGRCVVGMLSLERETSCSQTHVCNSLHVGTSPRPFLMRSEQLK